MLVEAGMEVQSPNVVTLATSLAQELPLCSVGRHCLDATPALQVQPAGRQEAMPQSLGPADVKPRDSARAAPACFSPLLQHFAPRISPSAGSLEAQLSAVLQPPDLERLLSMHAVQNEQHLQRRSPLALQLSERRP